MRNATLVIVGATSFSSCSRFPTISGPGSSDSPVTFPPGRARLATTPMPTGSVMPHITMGIVAIARLAAGHRPPASHEQIRLEADQLVDQVRGPLVLSLGVTPFDDEVLALDPSPLTQALAQGCLEDALLLGPSRAQDTDPIHLPRLLRLGGARRREREEYASEEMSSAHVRLALAPFIARPS